MSLQTKPEQTNKKKWELQLLIFGSIALVFVIVHAVIDGYRQQSEGEENGLFNSVPVISVSAIDLENEFALQEDLASKKYKDKKIRVTGKILEIDKYRTGDSFVVLEKSNEAQNIKIQCVFKKENAVDSLSKGETIAVQGTLGLVKNVIIIDKSEIKNKNK